jgi:hypothetical protein
MNGEETALKVIQNMKDGHPDRTRIHAHKTSTLLRYLRVVSTDMLQKNFIYNIPHYYKIGVVIMRELPFHWDFLQDNLPPEKLAELRRRFMEEWRSGKYTREEMIALINRLTIKYW